MSTSLMAAFLFARFLCFEVLAKEEWNPPANITAYQVLKLAKEATADGDYKLSLKIHEWIFNSSPEVLPELAGVRRSFAMKSWRELSASYDPAKASLERTVLRTKSAIIKRKGDVVELFRDYAALIKEQTELKGGLQLFLSIEDRDFPTSKQIFNNNYEVFRVDANLQLLKKYLDETYQFERFSDLVKQSIKLSANRRSVDLAISRFESRVENLASDLKTIGEETLANELKNKGASALADLQ